MSPLRKTALVAGVLYLLTFVSIPTLFLYGPVNGANYIIGAGPDTAVIIGGILEIIVALAGIGTAVVLFPVLKRQNEAVALGLVASRVLEASTIFVGVAFLLSIVTLRQAGAGADALVTGHALAALYDRIFLHRTKLHAGRKRPVAGLPAVPVAPGASRPFPDRNRRSALLLACYLAVMFGLLGQHAPLAALSALPVALFEFSLGVWLVVKGFKPSPILSSSYVDVGDAFLGMRGNVIVTPTD